jgi:hypothetical protein
MLDWGTFANWVLKFNCAPSWLTAMPKWNESPAEVRDVCIILLKPYSSCSQGYKRLSLGSRSASMQQSMCTSHTCNRVT